MMKIVAATEKTCVKTRKSEERIGRISLLFSGFSIILFLCYALYKTPQFEWKEDVMHDARYWETADELATISLCPEGCVHLRVGRAIIKMTREEFLSLRRLTDKAAREMQFPEAVLAQQRDTGH
jgi:hypothetical protein